MSNTSNYEVKTSFVIPCYNDGDEIERAVLSILDQDFDNLEVIIVNDGSTDNSKEIIESLVERDKRVTAIHFETNQGACNARNAGDKIAKGEYYIHLPADSFLYPGMLRTWIDTLDDHPDYAFLYSGYRVTDKDHEPMPNADYFFHPFDPYLLEVSNYIDGSFPIRASDYWRVAKLMNDSGKQKSDGLWDPNIKSLQDWDFWLSVVKEGQGKGIYVQDICFETTAPHPGGLSFDSYSNWLERTETIKKKHDIPIRRLCVASLGAGFHAKRIAYILGADFQEMPSWRPHRYDAIYSIGFYPQFSPQQDQMFWVNANDQKQGRVPCKKILHFVGTDLLQFRRVSLDGIEFYKNYFKEYIDELLVEADFTQKEFEGIFGFKPKIVPLSPGKLYEVMPLPEKFTVACYMPGGGFQDFYNQKLMIEVAKRLPDIQFKFFGDPMALGIHSEAPNIELCGYLYDMESFIKECSAVMRFPVHDGLPISVIEFLTAGRYAIVNVPMPEVCYVPGMELDNIVKGIEEAREKSKEGPNVKASEFWRKECDHEKYRNAILDLAAYHPKEYWEQRAASWIKQAKEMPIEKDAVKEIFDQVKPKSVIDLGCGDGRWYPILKEWGVERYLGVDISKNLTDKASEKYPEAVFLPVRVEMMPNEKEKFDLAFSYTTFEHIKPENFPMAVKAVKKMAKKLLLIEPINFQSRYYCFVHDYEKAFKVIAKKELADKVIMLCNLQSQ